MKKPVIAVDIDDVLASSTDALRQVVNKKLGIELPAEAYVVEADYWGYYDAVWEANGISGQISLDELNPQMRVDQSHVLPMPGAFAALSQMRSSYDFIVITARSSDWEDATRVWLQKNFPGIFEEVFFTNEADGVKEKGKGDLCLEAGATWLIDDNIGHALSALEKGVDVIVFGEYGWHHRGIPDGVVACKNWLDVGEYFSARG